MHEARSTKGRTKKEVKRQTLGTFRVLHHRPVLRIAPLVPGRERSNQACTWVIVGVVETRPNRPRRTANRSLFLVTAALTVALILQPSTAVAAEPASQSQTSLDRTINGAAIAFDVVVLRPLAIAALAVGAVFLPVAALMASAGGRERIEEATDLFVLDPYAEAFGRPLGDF
jgi:hypothetical protein